MDKCYVSQKHKKERIINYAFTLLDSITLCVLGAVVAISTPESDKHVCILLCLGLLILLYGMLFDLYMSREYELSENGIYIRYAKKKTFFFHGRVLAKSAFA